MATRTRLLLIMHRTEQLKPTNTGGLAVRCLQNSRLWVRGRTEEALGPLATSPDALPLLLFPSQQAIPLREFADSPRPVVLVVPDGTWKQASKMRRRVESLAGIPTVSLPPGPATEYRLRREEREGGLATMEAIARAYGILEGPEVQLELERVFRIMVGRTLWSRGTLQAAQVCGGIPDAARDGGLH